MQFENQFNTPWYDNDGTNIEPKNAKPATYVIGTGDNTITVTYGHTTQGNGYKLAIVVASGNTKPLAAAFATDTLTITLATNGVGAADDTKNTYALVAAKIKTVAGFDATVAGTGIISAEAAADEFTDGQEGTICHVPGTFIKKSETEWYVNIAPNSKFDANWRKLTVATY